MLASKIANKQTGIVLYGITPPKKGTEPTRVEEIASLQIERLHKQAIDGLVIYDIQDEDTRTTAKRPFPFMETLDAAEYSHQYLEALTVPKIIYRAVGKHSKQQLTDFLQQNSDNLTVFVGAASKDQAVTMNMQQAYQLKQSVNAGLPLGGVVIAERHKAKGDEHLRVVSKTQQGCSFFISQGVYDVEASKNLLSDYYYHCQQQQLEMVPILFTLTPCGSAKTLEFMKWLGISVPKWMQNELLHAHDILQKSVDYSEQCWLELKAFADEKGIPVGVNIESVAIRKVEVERQLNCYKELMLL